jgi:4-amino-4-deoxy-L-arabinose transferase-like glycosyltransferase
LPEIKQVGTSLLSDTTYKLLFFLLAIVYTLGLFVPLMDNDAAHHANIALHMHLSGDYVSLIDDGKDYLDKPHFHFWLCALSYKILGVTTFAYKLPSFLFSVVSVYATFRLGKALYNQQIGKLAALMLASSFAFILANNDVRMDAILTASIVFATWQLVAVVQDKKIINIILAPLGMAVAFCTKGHIGVIIPSVAIFFYMLYKQDYKLIFNWRWLLLVLLFLLFITPVVYCYYLQYNLHPEKIVRGRDHINGVQFILFGQSIERFNGENFGSANKNDYLFFIHSFLWAFAPWSILTFIAVVRRVMQWKQRQQEWLTTGSFLLLLLIVSFAGFKLPHYLNIIFPFTSIMVAAFVEEKRDSQSWVKKIYWLHIVVAFICLLLILAINVWIFPVFTAVTLIPIILLLAIVFYFFITPTLLPLQKAVALPVAVMVLLFFSLNNNFYTALLKYQAGNSLAAATRGKINPTDVYSWNHPYSFSYYFYTASFRKPFTDAMLQPGKKVWLIYDVKHEPEILRSGYVLANKFETASYPVTRLTGSFLNPETRNAACSKMIIAELKRKL